MIEWILAAVPRNVPFVTKSSSEEHFKSRDDLFWYLVREILQNSIDARYNPLMPAVVRMSKIFVRPECLRMEQFKAHLRTAMESHKDTGKDECPHRRFKRALACCEAERIPALVIGDYNTTGAEGTGDDHDSGWFRLVYSEGGTKEAAAGGSHGIGKIVPFMATPMRTVLYSTMTNQGEKRFLGVSRIASHTRKKENFAERWLLGSVGEECDASGDQIPPDFARNEPGTDVIMPGFEFEDGWEDVMLRHCVDNFWPAILQGTLVVEAGLKVLDKHRLKGMEDSDQFLKTGVRGKKYEVKNKILGNCGVRILDGGDNHVAMHRSQGMIIQTKKFSGYPPFTGVFECSDKRGNEILRGAEGPAHDNWNRNKNAANAANECVREALDKHFPSRSEDSYTPEMINRLFPPAGCGAQGNAKPKNDRATKSRKGPRVSVRRRVLKNRDQELIFTMNGKTSPEKETFSLEINVASDSSAKKRPAKIKIKSGLKDGLLVLKKGKPKRIRFALHEDPRITLEADIKKERSST